MDLSRRDLLVSLLQALFLALFPWLRNERGERVVRAAAEHMVAKDPVAVDKAIFKGGEFRVSIGVKGFELSPEMYAKLRELNEAYVPGDGPLAAFIPVNRRRV